MTFKRNCCKVTYDILDVIKNQLAGKVKSTKYFGVNLNENLL